MHVALSRDNAFSRAARGRRLNNNCRMSSSTDPDADHDGLQGSSNKKQVGLTVVAVVTSLALIYMAFRDIERGDEWHRQSRLAAKRMREDDAHLIPLIYKPGTEIEHTAEEGDKFVVGDREGAPIDQWMSGVAGAEQKLAATYDVDPGSKPQPLVHLPDYHGSDNGPADPGRKAWGSLDFQADEAKQIAEAAKEEAKEAARLQQETRVSTAITNKAQDMQQQGVEVKKLMTSKTFARWKHCVDYYTPAKLTNSMMQIIENGDLGKAPQQVVQAMQSLQRLGCVFFTQNCVKPNRPELVTASQTKAFTDREYQALPPNVPRKGLGSCAIVGHSDRLLGQSRGEEIDEHTTIIRMGFYLRQPGTPPVDTPSAPPVQGFQYQVGSKTSFVYLPNGRIFTAPHMPANQETLMWQTPEWQVLQRSGRKKQLAGRGKYEQVIDGVGKHIYAAFRSTKLRADWRHSSDELRAVMWWLASGLCSSIDVYGMAFPHETGETHSRPYWSTSSGYGQSPWPGPQVSKQNAAMEMYAMHAAMRAGLLCIHTH